MAALATKRARRVDEAVAAAIGQPDGEDRLAVCPDLGDPRALFETNLDGLSVAGCTLESFEHLFEWRSGGG